MRLRIRFTKLGKVRFTSHRDVARIWERALRRAQVPVARSQGFSPRPRLHFGLALSTGYESLAEYLDVDLAEGAAIHLAGLPERLTASLPAGFAATAVGEVAAGTSSLQHAVVASRWDIEVLGLGPATLTDRVADLMAAPELVTTRSRKGADVVDDVRPHLLALQLLGSTDGGVLLGADLAARDRALRPSELVALLGDGATEGRIRRIHQFTEQNGVRSEPLTPVGNGPVPPGITAAARPPAPHAMVRAS